MKAAVLLLSLATMAAACSEERSLSVVAVFSSSGSIAGVAQLDTVPPGPLPSRCDF